MKTGRKSSDAPLVAAGFAAVAAVTLPLQTFLANAALYDFTLARAALEFAGIFAVFALGAFLLMEFPGRFLRGRVEAFFTAATVCVYLESGILSLGLPELNGAVVPELAEVKRGLFDAGVWAAVVVTFLVFTRALRPYLKWIVLATLVLSAASLLDVRPSAAADAGKDGTGLVNQMTVVANVKYSPKRNLLVFVLDSMPGASAAALLERDGALAAEFPGFTVYPRNLGMHECTKRGVPGLVTGRHYDPAEMAEGDYPMTMYSPESFVTAAREKNWLVAFSPDLLPYGYTNLPVEKRVERREKRRARDRFAFLRQSKEVPFLSLFDTVAFRYSPFFFKGPILYSRIRHAVKGRHDAEGFWGEKTMYPELASRPVSGEAAPFLGFFHSWGVHPPWAKSFEETATEKFRSLGALFSALREKGVYDKAMIVVTSDHGLDASEPPPGYPPSASAFLMVKGEGASAPLAFSQLQTSHARIAPLVKAALDRRLDADSITGILRDEHPLFRAEVREGGREYFRTWP